MCGIAGIYLKDSFHGQFNAEDLVDQLLLGIENRGRDATGIVSVSKGGENVTLEKLDVEARYFIQLRDFLVKDTRYALLHTRLGTKGSEKQMENNHPVVFKSCYATHNGVIYNDDTLFAELDVERVADVDSIIVPTLVSSTGGMDEALKSLPRLKGSWACAIADPKTNPDEVLLVKGDRSPLVILNTPKVVVWASTKNAIEDAWKAAIGTPPKWNKYEHLTDGEYFRIKDGGATEQGRFIERTTYQGRSFRADHDWENNSGGVRHYPGSTSNAQDRTMCFECGERAAFYTVKDSFFDPTEKRHVEWDVPVCFHCKEIEKGDLTYAYATEKVKLRFRKEDDQCELCQKETAAGFDKHGTALCQRCLDTEPKMSGLIRGGTTESKTEGILRLNPGDLIPFNLRSSFKEGCESCASELVSYIGKDGFAICGMCKIAEEKSKDPVLMGGIDVTTCDACDVWYEKSVLSHTIHGLLCKGCIDSGKEAEESVLEDEEGVSDDPDALGVRVVKRTLQGRRPSFLPWIREAEERYPVSHRLTTLELEVATECYLHPPFAVWLLDFDSKDKLPDPTLTAVWDRVRMCFTRKVMESVAKDED